MENNPNNEFKMIKELKLLDTTLREGMQLRPVNFTIDQQLAIVQGLNEFGIDIIELTSAVAYPGVEQEIIQIKKHCSGAKLVVHSRAVRSDIERALSCGVDGIDLFLGTSLWSQEFGHGRKKDEIIKTVVPFVQWLKKEGVFVRYGAEDAFRTDIKELLEILKPIVGSGVDQIDLPDTVGSATPFQVQRTVKLVRQQFQEVDIKFHGHNDMGCAVANSLAAILGGANVIDVSLLGLGERVGITSLGGMVAALQSVNPLLLEKYNLKLVIPLERMVASFLGIQVPFNQPLSAEYAWGHSAGVHLNAIIKNPESYENLNPEVFGGKRILNIGSRLTGKNILTERAKEIGLSLTENQVLEAVAKVKTEAVRENRVLEVEEVDEILRGVEKSGDNDKK